MPHVLLQGMNGNDDSRPLPVAGADRLPVIALAMSQQEAPCNDEEHEKESSAGTIPPVPRPKADKGKARIDMRCFFISAEERSRHALSRIRRKQLSLKRITRFPSAELLPSLIL